MFRLLGDPPSLGKKVSLATGLLSCEPSAAGSDFEKRCYEPRLGLYDATTDVPALPFLIIAIASQHCQCSSRRNTIALGLTSQVLTVSPQFIDSRLTISSSDPELSLVLPYRHRPHGLLRQDRYNDERVHHW
jgi:hypothetical protein